ncbi:Microtubule associated protein family protein isoform 3 [Hibiscus syriacus]|uniref:Microtubule associated protein family protein isoform 3 n=1 Tax=Hibiscus syriacus TaxID=106335 RepID=A0A6A2ZTF3_HIBSY|nr:Microtubule associated protein family protein isoform 3 [Hibiscus syriacus]
MSTPQSEPLLQVETTCALLYELQIIWDEVGETDANRDEMLLELEFRVPGSIQKKAMDERLVHIRQSDQNDGSLKEELSKIFPQLEEMKKRKIERRNQINDRLKQVEDHLSVLNSLCLVMGMDFKLMFTEFHPSLSYSEGFRSLQDLATTMLELWNLMDTPIEEQQMFQNVTCNIDASKHEITEPNTLSMDFIKYQNERACLKKRLELDEICRKTHLVVSQSVIEDAIKTFESGVVDAANILEQIELQIPNLANPREGVVLELSRAWEPIDNSGATKNYLQKGTSVCFCFGNQTRKNKVESIRLATRMYGCFAVDRSDDCVGLLLFWKEGIIVSLKSYSSLHIDVEGISTRFFIRQRKWEVEDGLECTWKNSNGVFEMQIYGTIGPKMRLRKGQAKRDERHLRDRILHLDLAQVSETVCEQRCKAIAELKKLIDKDESYWHQRSRLEGTFYVTTSYFTSLFRPSGVAPVEEILQAIDRCVMPMDNEMLNRNFTSKEVIQAFSQINPSKAPYNFLVAHELIHYLKDSKNGPNKGVAIKLDMKKAYDMVE